MATPQEHPTSKHQRDTYLNTSPTRHPLYNTSTTKRSDVLAYVYTLPKVRPGHQHLLCARVYIAGLTCIHSFLAKLWSVARHTSVRVNKLLHNTHTDPHLSDTLMIWQQLKAVYLCVAFHFISDSIIGCDLTL